MTKYIRVARIVAVLLGLTCVQVAAATSVSGQIQNEDGTALHGANVIIEKATGGTSTDAQGRYELSGLEPGEYTLIVSFLGYAPESRAIVVEKIPLSVDFALQSDPLGLETVVVTGVFNPASKITSSVAVSTLNAPQIERRNARGTGDLLAAVPGNTIDMSAGEVGAQIYPRGLSTGAVADIGFKYSSLQEDGLPVLSTQFQFAVIDMFHRADATVDRLEAIRGGSASVSSANSPGGIFNFISKTGGPQLGGSVRLSSGMQGSGNPMGRTDVSLGGPLAGDDWTFHVGGFYRHDEGARDLPFAANKGGQLKGNVVRSHDSGFLKLYGKLLDDQVIFYKQLPVADLDGPDPFPGFDLNSSSLIVDVRNQVPSAADPGVSRSYDGGDGIQVDSYSAGAQLLHEFADGWELSNNLKYSYSVFDHFQSSGHNLLSTVNAS